MSFWWSSLAAWSGFWKNLYLFLSTFKVSCLGWWSKLITWKPDLCQLRDRLFRRVWSYRACLFQNSIGRRYKQWFCGRGDSRWNFDGIGAALDLGTSCSRSNFGQRAFSRCFYRWKESNFEEFYSGLPHVKFGLDVLLLWIKIC